MSQNAPIICDKINAHKYPAYPASRIPQTAWGRSPFTRHLASRTPQTAWGRSPFTRHPPSRTPQTAWGRSPFTRHPAPESAPSPPTAFWTPDIQHKLLSALPQKLASSSMDIMPAIWEPIKMKISGQTHLNFACIRLTSVIIYTTRYAGGTETLRKLFSS